MTSKCNCECRDMVDRLTRIVDRKLAELQSNKDELAKLLEDSRFIDHLTDKDIAKIRDRGVEMQKNSRAVVNELVALRQTTQAEIQGLRQAIVELMA